MTTSFDLGIARVKILSHLHRSTHILVAVHTSNVGTLA